MANGQFLVQTGRNLRELDSRSLYDVGFYLMRATMPTKEEADARAGIDRAIRDRMYEEETGMPAVSQWMAPADAAARPQSNGAEG
jgi:hypothetical protein